MSEKPEPHEPYADKNGNVWSVTKSGNTTRYERKLDEVSDRKELRIKIGNSLTKLNNED